MLKSPNTYIHHYKYDGRYCAKHITRFTQPVDKKIFEDIKREFFSQNKPSKLQGNFNGDKPKEFILPHLKSKYLLKFDIVKCFNSITYELFEKCSANKIDNMDMIKSLYFSPNLVVGLSSSAIISEVVLVKIIDNFINALLNSKEYKSLDVKYTRYYDDIYLSGDDKVALSSLKVKIIKQLSDNGLTVNLKKSSLSKTDNSIILKAKINQQNISIGRKFKNNLRLQIHKHEVYNMDTIDLETVSINIGLIHEVLGKVSHIINTETNPSKKWINVRRAYIEELDNMKSLRDELMAEAFN